MFLCFRCNGLYFVTFLNYHQKDYFNKQGERYYCVGEVTDEKLDEDVIFYSKQASEGKVIINLPNSTTAVKADMIVDDKRIRNANCLYFGFLWREVLKIGNIFPEILQDEQTQLQLQVEFVLKYSYFDRLHRAINELPNSIISRLIPDEVNQAIQKKVSCNLQHMFVDIIGLDGHQMKALNVIMDHKSSKAPVLIIGSFGTGKTRLLARAAYQLLRENPKHRVLICAHHQRSADTFIESYFAKMHRQHWHTAAVRLVPSTQYYYPLGCEEFYKTIHDDSFKKNLKQRRVPIIVTTFSTSLHLLSHVSKGYFTHILLDEGAQSREPESIAPFCLATEDTKIVIAGDHKQVMIFTKYNY